MSEVKQPQRLFRIIADYRPNNPNKPTYYVRAKNKKKARERFSEIMDLHIYGCEEITDETERQQILLNPNHTIF